MDYISYEDFKKLKMQIGTIKSVEPVPETDKLLRCEIDFGETELRQIVSGIREFFPDHEKLINKQVLYVTNLEPRTIKGIESHGMLMAVDGPDGDPVLLTPESPVNPGTSVR